MIPLACCPLKRTPVNFANKIQLKTTLFHDFFCLVSSEANTLFLLKLIPEAYNFIKIETLTLVFSCEFCEILRTPISNNICERLLLSNRLRSCNFFGNASVHILLCTAWHRSTFVGMFDKYTVHCQKFQQN